MGGRGAKHRELRSTVIAVFWIGVVTVAHLGVRADTVRYPTVVRFQGSVAKHRLTAWFILAAPPVNDRLGGLLVIGVLPWVTNDQPNVVRVSSGRLERARPLRFEKTVFVVTGFRRFKDRVALVLDTGHTETLVYETETSALDHLLGEVPQATPQQTKAQSQ
jgi:hypothetical protein